MVKYQRIKSHQFIFDFFLETNVFQNQQQQNPSKRLRYKNKSVFHLINCLFSFYRTSPKDDEQRHSSLPETSESNLRDPFALQPHSKGQHQQVTSASNPEKNWQSIIQQQQYHISNSYSTQFPSRASRLAGSITQGSPIRSSTDQQQYPSAPNNQLVNPRYSHHINKSKIN
jgi:type I site-specific restriction endonuclease